MAPSPVDTTAPQTKPRTLRLTEATKEALQHYADSHDLSLSAAAEQLIGEALAARGTAAIETAAAPAFVDQVRHLVEQSLREMQAQVRDNLDHVALEVAVTRLLAYALIGYTYGEQEARTAEEGALRLATRALARGQMASFPAGAIR